MTDSTIEVFRQRLEEHVRFRLPSRRNLSVTGIEKLPVGFSYETYLFSISWNEDDGVATEDMVIRMEPEHGLIPPYDVRPQYEILKRLHGTTIPVPKVHWLEPDGSILGRPFFVMEMVQGEVMYQHALQHPGMQAQLRQALADVIVAIHELDWQSLGLSVLGVPGTHTGHAEKEIDRWERQFKENSYTPYPLMTELFRYLKNNIPQSERTTFCHCDIQPANILVRDGRVVAVLDWELATIGDPVSDLGWSIATIERYFGSFWNENNFILGYYEEKTGSKVDEESLRFWKLMSFVKGITMVFTGLRAGIELTEPKANLLALYPVQMGNFPDGAAGLLGF